jgi:hypothetical protein
MVRQGAWLALESLGAVASSGANGPQADRGVNLGWRSDFDGLAEHGAQFVAAGTDDDRIQVAGWRQTNGIVVAG